MTYYSESDPFWGAETPTDPAADFPGAHGGTAYVYTRGDDAVTAKVLTGPGTLTLYSFLWDLPFHLSVDGVDLGAVLTGPEYPTSEPPGEYTVEIASGEHTIRIWLSGSPGVGYAWDGGDWTPTLTTPPTLSLNQAVNVIAGTTGLSTPHAMNIAAGTVGLSTRHSANAYAGTTGLSIRRALNAAAGTTGLSAHAAANVIVDNL